MGLSFLLTPRTNHCHRSNRIPKNSLTFPANSYLETDYPEFLQGAPTDPLFSFFGLLVIFFRDYLIRYKSLIPLRGEGYDYTDVVVRATQEAKAEDEG